MNVITQIPFFHGSCDNNNNDGYPEVLPFSLKFDEKLSMFVSYPNSILNEYLTDIYRSGNLVDGSISNESGMIYQKPII